MATPERQARIEGVLDKRQTTLTVVFENVHDPHNISAVIRSCDAVGIVEAHGIYPGREVFPELGAKTSASAMKWVDVTLHESVEDCYSALRAAGMKIYTTYLSQDSQPLYALDLTQPVALVFGNEKAGVTTKAMELADGNFLIPQVGMVQSLNISVACAVSLYEAFRQRNAAGMYTVRQLDPVEYQTKLDDWMDR